MPAEYNREEWAANYYSRQVDRVAAGLRDLADKVEQEGRARPGSTGRRDGRPEYVAAATRVVHALSWGFANLPVETLLTNANDADQISRPETAESEVVAERG
jgi:hypothetical protein